MSPTARPLRCTFCLATVVALALGCARPAAAQTDEAVAEAKATLFDMEQRIYASRKLGNMDLYVAHASPNYLGWPPIVAKPERREKVNANQTNLAGSQEQNELTLAGFTLDGDTAIIYDINHRTRRGDGAPVDEYFDNIHVWVKRDGQWLLLGTMPRPSQRPTEPLQRTSP
jgi:hypothetical protein